MTRTAVVLLGAGFAAVIVASIAGANLKLN